MTNTPDLTPEAMARPIRFRPVLSVDSRVGMRMDLNGGYIRYEDYKALSAPELRPTLMATARLEHAIREARRDG